MASAALLAACGQSSSSDSSTKGNANAPEVEVITLEAKQNDAKQDLPGRIVALRSAQVRARVEGVLEKQLFTDGAEVKAGKSLFLIDARLYRASADAAEAEVQAQSATLSRYTPLLASKAISPQEFDLAKSKLKAAQAALAKARLDLENAQVLAPITGRAGRALVTEGALVGKGEATHLVTVEQLDPIRVEFTQPHADVLSMKRHTAVDASKQTPPEITLTLEDGSSYELPGRLKFNDLAVDPATGSIAMRAEFPNPKRVLLPGTFVRVNVPSSAAGEVLRVPQRAVQTSTLGQSVMIVDAENKMAVRTIVTQAFAGGDYVVRSGLAAGDRVVVNGGQKVKPGSVVTPIAPEAPATPTPAQPVAPAK
jgi:membrane fusion protein, multidrug efflux system